MKVVKSLHSGILHRTLEMEGKKLFSLASLWGFRLSTGQPVLEKDLWPEVLSALPSGQALDAGLPKFKAEFLVAGSFLSSELTTGGRVEVECGDLSKSLAVFGDRYWSATSFDGPMPITEIPLTYEQAFGGAGSLENPVGKGITDVEYEGVKRRPLPNVEYLSSLVSSKNDKPKPASLGNVDMTWQPRSRLAGTYDEEYVNRYMPGFPPDMDPTYFCCAASDQWFDDFPVGGEAYRITNMNLEYPQLTGRLPKIRARLFLNVVSKGEARLMELESRIDTVWLLPNQDCGILIHRGVLELDPDAEFDITATLIAHEAQHDAPRELVHYEEQLARRTDPEKGMIYSFNTDAIIPQGVLCGFKQILVDNQTDNSVVREQFEIYTGNQKAKLEDQINERFQEIEKPLTDHGFDGLSIADLQAKQTAQETETGKTLQAIMDRLAPKDPENPNAIDLVNMDLSAINDLSDFLKLMAEDEEQKAKNGIREKIEELKSQPSTESMVAELENVLKELALPPLLPRIRNEVNAAWRTIEAQLEDTKQKLVIAQSLGVDPGPVLEQLDSLNQTSEKMGESLEAAEGAYCMSAHYIEHSRSPHEGEEEWLAGEFKSSIGNLQKFEHIELAFTYLPGLTLSGKTFVGGYFEHADLSGSAFDDVRMVKTVLAHANLTDAVFTNCTFSESNLGACDFSGARFEQCQFEETTFGRARFSQATFINCTFKSRMDGFLEARLHGASFIECDMESCIFNELDMADCIFERSRLDNTNLIYCQLENARFTESSLKGTCFIGAKAMKTDFTGCSMENVRFVDECILTECLFTKAYGSMGNFRGSQLDRADFSGSQLQQCDFSDASLFGATMNNASIKKSFFDRANLELANFNKCDAMEASFQEARLVATDFRNANLYSANFYSVEVGETDFRGANLKKTLFKDWRPGRE